MEFGQWQKVAFDSRKAAKECSPRRKPWVKAGCRPAPAGRKTGRKTLEPRGPVLFTGGTTLTLQNTFSFNNCSKYAPYRFFFIEDAVASSCSALMYPRR